MREAIRRHQLCPQGGHQSQSVAPNLLLAAYVRSSVAISHQSQSVAPNLLLAAYVRSSGRSSVAISGTQSSPHRQVRLVRVHAAEHERCSVRRRALGVDAADRAVPVGCDGRRS